MEDVRELMLEQIDSQKLAVLRDQTFTLDSPGPMLRDIDAMIDTIGEGLPTTSDYFALPLGVLHELNQRMTTPLLHDLQRPQLRSFPTLMGLFALLRGCGLAVGQSKPKRVIAIHPQMLDQFRAMNETEKAMTLLSAWLFDCTFDCVGLSSVGVSGLWSSISSVYLRLKSKVTTVTDQRFGVMYGTENIVTLSLLHEFGWVKLNYEEEPEAGKAVRIARAERTPFGDAMFVAICGGHLFVENEARKFQKKMQKLFPAWKRKWTSLSHEFQPGSHIFKVAMGKTWRRLAVPALRTWDDFADEILNAFCFDHDHLYQFEMRDSNGKKSLIVGSNLDGGDYFADDTRIGDVPMFVGDSCVFHYDFGDDWRFKVTLESIDDSQRLAESIKVTAESGEAPLQYGDDD